MIVAFLRRVGFACAAFLIVQTSLMAQAKVAVAGETVLMRKPVDFNQCPSVIEAILGSMNAHSRQTVVVRDTGAHYTVKLKAVEANLVFICNAVTEQIEIKRQVPGDLSTQDETAAAN